MWQSILILFSHSRSLRCNGSSQWCGVRWGRQCLMEGWNHLDDDDEEEKPWKVICLSSSTRESSKVHTNFICFRVNFQIYSYSIVLPHTLFFSSTRRNGRDGKNKNYAEMQAHKVFFSARPEVVYTHRDYMEFPLTYFRVCWKNGKLWCFQLLFTFSFFPCTVG